MKDKSVIYPSNKLLIELAKICKSVYGSPINHKILTIKDKKLNHQRIIHGSLHRGFCRLFWNEEYVIIAFRGTRENLDWQISNLKLFPTRLKNCGTEPQSIKVHFGFQKALYYTDKTTGLKSIDAIYNHLESNDLLNGDRKIIITGHSLGAAIATLFAVKLRFNYKNITDKSIEHIILFGSPAVGFDEFKRYYGDLNSRTLRVINGSDIVPFTPPFFFRHIGESIWYNKTQVIENESWLFRLLYSLKLPISNFFKEHSMEKYIETLKGLN